MMYMYLDSLPGMVRQPSRAFSKVWRAENRARALGWLFSHNAR